MPAVESTIHINRTLQDTFAFISDYERDPRWRSEVVEMNYQSPGPTGIGRLALEKSKVFGRRLETLTEVTEYEPDNKIVSRSISGPTPVISYRFVTPDGAGTRFTYRLEVDISKEWFFRLLRPALMPLYQRTIESYLKQLKQILESEM
ncbi:MAG TPA: SRPBCC family protein [Anaerolineales bacterium]|nr:SRPBCC family protein [Anaerolineales bacterium]